MRYGVAPDHQKIKSVTRIYERTMKDSRVRYFGNVDLGADTTHADLKAHYDQIVYAVGAQSDRKLEIPGEDLEGSFSATEFVAWYNAHPDFRHYAFDLSVESVAVIGVGNVAMDVTRILAKSVVELETTDISAYALGELRESNVRRIHIFARRGPVQAKFTNPEIKELGELEIADVIVNPADLVLDDASKAELEGDRAAPAQPGNAARTGGTRRNRQTEADHLPLFAFTHGDLRYRGGDQRHYDGKECALRDRDGLSFLPWHRRVQGV